MQLILSVLLLMAVCTAQANLTQRAIPGEFIISSHTQINQKSSLFQGEKINETLTIVRFTNKNISNKAVRSLMPIDADWISPNFQYIGNPHEVDPRDEHFKKQTHHKLIKSLTAWDFTLGAEQIVVAVTDNGVQMDHPDLKQSWWTNRSEIPNNSIDDDNNGYVDDINGWDFNRNIADPSAKSDREGYTPNSHGTHVSGIIAASLNNEGIVGVAPNVKIMPLKFFEPKKPWTSAIVLKTYLYAIDNGANIISTSYNIDGLVNDKAYLEALKQAKLNDVLVVNSAGNSNTLNPPRQKLSYPILVCSTKSNSKSPKEYDIKSKFSSYGTGIDICAPGDPIYSTLNGTYRGGYRYGEMSGTSMAAPIVAGVLALVWSQHPNWTGSQVRDHVLRNADNIDNINRSKYRGKLGTGRVNAYRAASTTSF